MKRKFGEHLKLKEYKKSNNANIPLNQKEKKENKEDKEKVNFRYPKRNIKKKSIEYFENDFDNENIGKC